MNEATQVGWRNVLLDSTAFFFQSFKLGDGACWAPSKYTGRIATQE
jgi:hypothetical protein